MTEQEDNKQILWEKHVKAYANYAGTIGALRTNLSSSDVIDLVRKKLCDSSPLEGVASILLISAMAIEERKTLLYDLVNLASHWHRLTRHAQDLILLLPREWLRENIEPCVEKVLERDTYEEYWAILTLYDKLGFDDLTLKLAQRAAQSEDEHIRDAGETYLEKLESGKK